MNNSAWSTGFLLGQNSHFWVRKRLHAIHADNTISASKHFLLLPTLDSVVTSLVLPACLPLCATGELGIIHNPVMYSKMSKKSLLLSKPVVASLDSEPNAI